ncbi:MAG TPA: DUF6797 domain-containing protein [Planctomycetota bacterium]|nr:DUF6797 domain-containing protein [Planctomycetota bacterium]
MNRTHPFLAALAALSALAFCSHAGEAPKPRATKGTLMDYGPFLTYCVNAPLSKAPAKAEPGPKKPGNLTAKGVTIKLGTEAQASVCFDTDVMRVSAGWLGGTLDLVKTNIGDLKGTEAAAISGKLVFSSRNAPGWARGNNFADPRPDKRGPMPADTMHYKGLYLHGNKVILSYTVGASEILEMPEFIYEKEPLAFVRTIRLAKNTEPLTLVIKDNEDGQAPGKIEQLKEKLIWEHKAADGQLTTVVGAGGAVLVEEDGRLKLKLPVNNSQTQFTVMIWTAPEETARKFASILSSASNDAADISTFTKGGPPRWTTLTTEGVQGKDDGPYALDTLTLPETNPWNAWMRLSGIDFFNDGRIVVSTLNGDVWTVSGADTSLQKLTWQRVATGLFEPLGLRVVDEKIYVLGRDQITRLHDLNNDGEADYYENFNSDCVVHPSYHAFAFDLQTDNEGNFYYARGGNQIEYGFPNHSCILKVAKDGSKTETFATGFRAPNGMCVGPKNQITISDNQGHWIPASKIDWVNKGMYYSYPGDPRKIDFKQHKELIVDGQKPMCWIPHSQDPSSGGQVWVTSKNWGPLDGQLLHLSYGKCFMFLVLTQEVNGTMQAGTVKFPLTFASGVMRARFSPKDGQLYACGLKGWQTSGGKDGNLQRVRYTGKPINMPVGLAVKKNGIEIAFSNELDAASAGDDQNYGVEQWNYKSSLDYGSADYSVAEPDKKGHDTVPVKSVKLGADKKTVFLEIDGLKPVQQMSIKCKLKAADGSAVVGEIYNTINVVP